MLQLCVDEELTDRGGGKNSGKKGVASIDYIDQLLINFGPQNISRVLFFDIFLFDQLFIFLYANTLHKLVSFLNCIFCYFYELDVMGCCCLSLRCLDY